jgi:uncharacterized protein (TIGR02246 family)
MVPILKHSLYSSYPYELRSIMNLHFRVFFIVIPLLAGTSACQYPSSAASPDTAAPEAVKAPISTPLDLSNGRAERLLIAYSESFRAAWAASDAAGLAKLYAEDAVRVVSDQQLPIYGRSAVQSASEASFADETNSTTISTTTEVVRFLSSDIILGSGTYDIKNASGETVRSGLWSNAFRLEDGSLHMLMESAGEYALQGMDKVSLSVPQEIAAVYTGDGAHLLNQGVAAYVDNTNTGNTAAVAGLFLEAGLQAVSRNGRIIEGRNQILATMADAAASEGDTLSAWGYGYRPIGADLAIGWGAWKRTSQGEIAEYGLWANIWAITENGLMLISERAGPYSGG